MQIDYTYLMLHGPIPTAGLESLIEILKERYQHDAKGRIVATCTDGLLPRFVLVRAAEGCTWRLWGGLPEDLVAAVAKLAGREPGLGHDLPGSAAPPERLVMIERMLASSGEGIATHLEVVERDGAPLAEIWTLC